MRPPQKPWSELSGEVEAIALHMWEEHCVECAPPDCYQSCKLFEARADLKCARFRDGIVVNPNVSAVEGYGVEVFFRRWAKLETKLPEDPVMFSLDEARRVSKKLNGMESLARKLADFVSVIDPKRKVQGAQYAYHQRIFPKLASGPNRGRFDGFYLESYCEKFAEFTLELVSEEGAVLRRSISMQPGWNRLYVDREQWPERVKGGGLLRLVNNTDHMVGVLITALHLVSWKNKDLASAELLSLSEAEEGDLSLPKVKCVVFDLDNTLWRGVIGDDGPDGVEIREEVVRFIYELDKRGIICAVASKNEKDIAMEKIRAIGLEKHLLFPQIHWGPKSQSIKLIAEAMNVALDTFVFIDDNPFERSEVKKSLPVVRTYSENDLLQRLSTPEFDVPVTEQSQNRRLSYLAESRRSEKRVSQSLDVDEFLRSCHMKMEVLSPAQHVDRCLEMLDRTNQFNISGQRYSKDVFESRLNQGIHWCWSVKDDFGDYGIVGYLSGQLKKGTLVIEDFVMSCRVAQKRVEECLFTYLQAQFVDVVSDVRLRVVGTQRNGAIIKKLEDLGEVVSVDGQVREIKLHSDLPGSSVIDIVERG